MGQRVLETEAFLSHDLALTFQAEVVLQYQPVSNSALCYPYTMLSTQLFCSLQFCPYAYHLQQFSVQALPCFHHVIQQ